MSNTITFYLTPFWRRKPRRGEFSVGPLIQFVSTYPSFLPSASHSSRGWKANRWKKPKMKKKLCHSKSPSAVDFLHPFKSRKKLLRRFWSLGIKKPLDNFLLLPSSSSTRHQKLHGCFFWGFKILHLYCNSQRARLGFHILNFSFGKHQPHRWSNYCVWFHPTTCWS